MSTSDMGFILKKIKVVVIVDVVGRKDAIRARKIVGGVDVVEGRGVVGMIKTVILGVWR